MTKIDKIDLENISLIKKELKIKNISSIKIKKGDYEIELFSSHYLAPLNANTNIALESKDINNNLKTKSLDIEENVIKSPMVGVAYLSADPSTPPFAKVGQHVKQGDVLVLIEAMKTFNEIKATKSGIIKKISVLNNQPVEYGDDLIIFE
jgi:acetyl-CoA carboxylase biotin carboxyl carrier protein